MKMIKTITSSMIAMSIFFFLVTSCQKESTFVNEVDASKQLENTVQTVDNMQVTTDKDCDNESVVNMDERRPSPCYPTGYDVIPHITDAERCFGYGFFWWNNKCIVCY